MSCIDDRWEKLANILVNYSVMVRRGERVLITMMETYTFPLVRACYKAVLRAGGLPHVEFQSALFERDIMKEGDSEQVDWVNEMQIGGMKWADCYIGIRGTRNPYDFSDISSDLISSHKRSMGIVSAARNETRWVLTKVPNEALAQQAAMPLDDMMDFYFRSTLTNWSLESERLERIANAMTKGTKVRIIGKDTELSFSTEGRVYEACDGRLNMPDGEVFTSPIEDSVNGHIYFEFPGIYAGHAVKGIRLFFKDGKLVEYSSETEEDLLKQLIHMDEGSAKVGEFGIGLNYGIDRFCSEILYDEKIGGTVHIALGRGYPECGGKNDSALHWDIVKDMRQEGIVLLDDKVVMKNGEWKV